MENTEKNHYSAIVATSHAAASIAALTAAGGTSLGVYSMTDNIWISGLSGVAVASILGLGWWSLITAGSRARRLPNKFGIGGIGVGLAGLALATSGWAMATAIGGSAAMNQHNRFQVSLHEDALQAAHSRLTDQEIVIDNVSNAGAIYAGYAKAETEGDLGGASGCGPKCRSYQRLGASMNGVQDDLQETYDSANDLHSAAVTHLASARNQADPQDSLAIVSAAIAEMNSVDLDPGQVGMVQYSATAGGLQMDQLDSLTQAIVDADADAAPMVTAPSYEVLSEADATMRYAKHVKGAWIMAVGVDVAPFIMLLIVMLLAGEPLLREPRKLRKAVTDAEIRGNEEITRGNVVPISGEQSNGGIQ